MSFSLKMDIRDVGKLSHDPCHKLSYQRKTGLKEFKTFTQQLQTEISWRSSLRDKNEQIKTACYHHEQVFGCRF